MYLIIALVQSAILEKVSYNNGSVRHYEHSVLSTEAICSPVLSSTQALLIFFIFINTSRNLMGCMFYIILKFLGKITNVICPLYLPANNRTIEFVEVCQSIKK